MRISVITPSFNQAQFLPDNLASVAAQKGVEVEQIIVDPGSTDGATELARAAVDRGEAILIAEPDRGQSHGITKGFDRATGDVLAWLNSDDFYPAPDVLAAVARAFEDNPQADIVYGGVDFVGTAGEFLRKGFVNRDAPGLLDSFHHQVGIVQPGVFWRRSVFETLGGPSEDYEYCMDYEYWVRMADAGMTWVHLDRTLAHHRWWDGMKTSSGRGDSLIEHFKVCDTYFGYIHHKWLDRYAEFRATAADGVVNHAETVDAAAKDAAAAAAIRRFVSQDMLALLEGSQEPAHRETLDYIRQKAPDLRRVVFSAAEVAGAETLPLADPHAASRPAWHIPEHRLEAPGLPSRLRSYNLPANFHRFVDADWYDAQMRHSRARMADLAARRREVCVIVANGPSLNKTDFDLLAEADVMVSNFAVINPQLKRHATYVTVVNDLVADQGATTFNALDTTAILPFWLAPHLTEGENRLFVPATVVPEFWTPETGVFSWRSTVSFFNMQLAFALGYETVALVGFDHSYVQSTGLKEGDRIEQKDEDPNHFDPRYFKGKAWQAADTDKMEQMYLVARAAYAKAGRKIFNATVGGKLEVFARKPLAEVLEEARGTGTGPLAPPPAAAPLPRLLVVDMTATGNGTATGEVKAALLGDWPADRILQLAAPGADRLSLVRRDGEGWSETATERDAALSEIAAFDPQMILYRPLADRPALHALALQIIRDRPEMPLITWIMDDWPARAQAEDAQAFAPLEADLRWLLERSGLRLSISDAMSEAFETRYGHPFVACANAIDPALWAVPFDPGPLRLRYAGGMARDMNADSLLRIARAVEDLRAEGLDIVFEISTRDWWWQREKDRYEGLSGTTADTRTRDGADYRRWLREADALVLAYNFDEASLRYVRYSMANKMPECLASGAALLVHGPRGVATVDYLAGTGAVELADSARPGVLEAALRRLTDPAHRLLLAGRAREIAFTRHALPDLRQGFGARVRDLEAQAAARAAVARLQTEIEAIHRSFSWRLTEPMRKTRRMLQSTARPVESGAEQPVLPAADETALGDYLQLLHKSRSWRVTSPLRTVGERVKSVVRRKPPG